MSESGVTTAQRLGAGAGRLAGAWRRLPPERRLAAVAAIVLFLTLFLPWYQETVIASGTATKLRSASATLTGWGAFSFVEAAILLVAAGVLVLLYQRAEGRAFHIPGGDGGVITVAGLWACVLIIWRMFDKQGTSSHGQYATTSGIEWGIFVALAIAGLLAYAGSRIRLAHRPEPPLPGERRPSAPPSAPGRREARRAPPVRSEDDTPASSRPVPSEPRPRRARPVRSEDDTLPTRPAPTDDSATLRMGRGGSTTDDDPPTLRMGRGGSTTDDDPPTLRMGRGGSTTDDDPPTLRAGRAGPTGPDEQATIPLDGNATES
jgi:hypothetical protein